MKTYSVREYLMAKDIYGSVAGIKTDVQNKAIKELSIKINDITINKGYSSHTINDFVEFLIKELGQDGEARLAKAANDTDTFKYKADSYSHKAASDVNNIRTLIKFTKMEVDRVEMLAMCCICIRKLVEDKALPDNYMDDIKISFELNDDVNSRKDSTNSTLTTDKKLGRKWETSIGLNTILYGPPGTGKTYNSVICAVAICNEDGDVNKVLGDKYEEIKDKYDTLVEQGRIAFTTFHQSYGYEEFIEGIKPVMNNDKSSDENDNGSVLRYKIESGVFKRFCDRASDNKDQSYVFIIDEINRGNISKIFGELITLIEDTKRDGQEEKASAILPYSGEQFSVPSNVYILGTMNTADRSIALMDTALRRRFDFIEMMPNADLLEGVEIYNDDKSKSVNVKDILLTINRRIEFLFDREHTIGHAFFMKLRKEENRNLKTLAAIFKKSVIPLLQEYFYDDYEKIRMVLGDNGKENTDYQFILEDTVNNSLSIFRGNKRLENVKKYYINDGTDNDAFMHIESYIEILDSKTDK